jgi:DNA-binding response OmpR family regulator
LSGLRVLLVENHELFARTVVEAFLSDCDVTVCGSVDAATRLASAEQYDAILVDYDLDDGKGDEVVRRLRGGGSRARIIAISARDEGNEALLRAGANAVCRKADFALIRERVSSQSR